jgi:ATP-dependent protease ClpP protease subunit
MFDELVLYLPAAVEIQMEINSCGLDVVMSQAVSDICQGVTPQQHINRTGMAKAMDRVDML